MNEFHRDLVTDSHTLLQMLLHSSKDVELRLDAALKPVGVSATKWYTLRHLAESGGQLPLGKLAERLSCVKSNATQLVDRLAAEGLVQRVFDEQDRRIILAELTAEGYRRYEAGRDIVQSFEQALLSDFGVEERMVLSRFLMRLSSFSSS